MKIWDMPCSQPLRIYSTWCLTWKIYQLSEIGLILQLPVNQDSFLSCKARRNYPTPCSIHYSRHFLNSPALYSICVPRPLRDNVNVHSSAVKIIDSGWQFKFLPFLSIPFTACSLILHFNVSCSSHLRGLKSSLLILLWVLWDAVHDLHIAYAQVWSRKLWHLRLCIPFLV